MQRRDFLRSACQACAAMALIPVAATLEGCASTAKALTVTDGVLNVPLDALGNGNSTVVRANGLANKLMISKRSDGSYTALELNCPHKGGPIKEKEGQLVCGWHGSAFDLEGKLLKGPSKSGLKTYPVDADGSMLRVRLA
ncbi:MAG: Rieske 2Fe-2S domain-containing protein [Flavobacteriales bacterium]|nr:Rieske 2Fe-2S domain-containing protein [Flavobacteriales bacterium]